MNRIRKAQATIDVMRQAIGQTVENGGMIDYQSAVIVSSSGYEASAYLSASDYASDYIRLLSGQYVSAGDYVIVGQMGNDSWVEQILPQSIFSKMVMDYENSRIGLSGTGSAQDWDFGTGGEVLTSDGSGSAYWGIGISGHVAESDPHTQYQKESEKGSVNGYASLDGSTKVPIAQLPTGTTDTTVALGDAVPDHEAALDPHTGYVLESAHGNSGDVHTQYVLESTLSAQGDIPYATGASTWSNLALGDVGQMLVVNSAETAPSWRGASAAIIGHSADQTIGTGSDTYLSFDSEDYDTDSYHSTESGGSPLTRARLTAPWTGFYFVSLDVVFEGNASGRRYATIFASDGSTRYWEDRVYPSDTASCRVNVAGLVYLTAADYVLLSCYQNSGGNLDVTNARASIHFVGP